MGYVKRIAGIAAVAGAHPRRTRPGRAGDRRGRRSRPARGGPAVPTRAEVALGMPDRGERRARSGPLLHEARPPRGLLGVAQGAAPRAHHADPQYRRWRTTYVRSAAHAPAPQRRPRDPAALRAHLRRVAGAPAPARRHAHAGRLPPARAQPPVLAAAALPGSRRPGELPRQRDPVPVLRRRGPSASPALHLQEGQPPARLLRARGGQLRRERAAPHPRRDDRARRQARAQLHRVGVPLLLRRRHAARG